jgi:hypothetical protein
MMIHDYNNGRYTSAFTASPHGACVLCTIEIQYFYFIKCISLISTMSYLLICTYFLAGLSTRDKAHFTYKHISVP